MTPYAKLNDILNTTRYIKGAHKGEAPMGKRSKSHFRVRRLANDDLAVHFHNTDILTISAQTGDLTLDCEGWYDRPTTREAMNETLSQLMECRVYLGGRRFKGLSNTVLATPDGMYLYYDGMVVSPTGKLLSEPVKFRARCIDKNATKELAEQVEESGFKDMFRILWGSADVYGMVGRRRDVLDLVTDPVHANEWQPLIAYYARGWGYSGPVKRDADATWQSIMREAKKFMYITTDTEVTKL